MPPFPFAEGSERSNGPNVLPKDHVGFLEDLCRAVVHGICQMVHNLTYTCLDDLDRAAEARASLRRGKEQVRVGGRVSISAYQRTTET